MEGDAEKEGVSLSSTNGASRCCNSIVFQGSLVVTCLGLMDSRHTERIRIYKGVRHGLLVLCHLSFYLF